jgi:hypothetical protein
MERSIELPSGERITIDTFRPSDATGVADLFRAVYGEEYPIRLVYDPQGLIAAFEAQTNIPVVARTGKDKIVGYTSLFHSAPHLDVYEAGQGLVLPAFRGSGINVEINRYICQILAPSVHVAVLFGEPVCNHVYQQKTCIDVGYVETALEVDLMPAEAYKREKSATGRVSALGDFRIYRPVKQALYVPATYHSQLQFLYQGLQGNPGTAPSIQEPAPEGDTQIKMQIFDFARVARMAVFHTGNDFPSVFAQSEEEALFSDCMVIQIWLKLGSHSVDNVVEFLRRREYFLGGLLPSWLGEDALLMQRIAGKPNWDGIEAYSERAKRIVGMVRQDWEETRP